jgi:hypothetical protein
MCDLNNESVTFTLYLFGYLMGTSAPERYDLLIDEQAVTTEICRINI